MRALGQEGGASLLRVSGLGHEGIPLPPLVDEQVLELLVPLVFLKDARDHVLLAHLLNAH